MPSRMPPGMQQEQVLRFLQHQPQAGARWLGAEAHIAQTGLGEDTQRQLDRALDDQQAHDVGQKVPPGDGGIATLAPFFPRIAKAYLIGEAAPAFAATLGERIPYEISATLENAVAHAARDAAGTGEAEVVLLSPACASFDQFRNFEVRGDSFREAVGRLDGIQLFRKG